MATIEQLSAALVKADAAGDTEAARAFAGEIRKMQQPRASERPTTTLGEDIADSVASVGAGLGKGVGNTALNVQKLIGKGINALGGIGQSTSITDLIVPKSKNVVQQAGQWLINDATEGQKNLAQENAPYKERSPVLNAGGELGGEILITLPVGGLIAKGAGPVLQAVAPRIAAPLTNAIASSGMSTGARVAMGPASLSRGADIATRAAGGAITGGASAALVDPSSAGTGALIGGVAPGVIQAAGKVGSAIGNTMRGPAPSADTVKAVQAALNAGYVIPPTQAKPTAANRLMEGYAGKLTTAQNASARNSDVTNRLAARALGLGDDVQLSSKVLNDVRKAAGQAYEDVASLPIRPAQDAKPLMNVKAIPEFNPRDAVFDLRKARNDASAWYTSYGRTADPDSLAKAQAAKSLSSKLEKQLEDYATSVGRDDLVPAMVESRKLIAKTHSVEKAMNPTTGTIDARKLGSQLTKGKPLSDELRQAAEFANRFPKAAQAVEGMGSLPQASPLDWVSGTLGSAATGNVAPLVAGVLGRPLARNLALSPMVQNRLVQPATQNELARFLSSPQANQLLLKGAPIAATQ